MTAENQPVDSDMDRWEALEAESRERLEVEAKQAGREPEGRASDWDSAGPSWWKDPEGKDPSGPPQAHSGVAPDAAADPGRDVDFVGEAPEILLADADPAIGASIEQAMTDRGWIVRRVENGELALAEFLRLAPHCFVFDYSLPGIGGLDLLRKLSEFGVADSTRLVVNSTQTQAIHVQRALAIGAHRFLDRPTRSPDKLVDAVAGQLGELGVLDPTEARPAAHDRSARLRGQAPESSDRKAEPPSGGLFAEGSPGPESSSDSGSGSAPRTDDRDRAYRSSIGSGGGPPGSVPRLS